MDATLDPRPGTGREQSAVVRRADPRLRGPRSRLPLPRGHHLHPWVQHPAGARERHRLARNFRNGSGSAHLVVSPRWRQPLNRSPRPRRSVLRESKVLRGSSESGRGHRQEGRAVARAGSVPHPERASKLTGRWSKHHREKRVHLVLQRRSGPPVGSPSQACRGPDARIAEPEVTTQLAAGPPSPPWPDGVLLVRVLRAWPALKSVLGARA